MPSKYQRRRSRGTEWIAIASNFLLTKDELHKLPEEKRDYKKWLSREYHRLTREGVKAKIKDNMLWVIEPDFIRDFHGTKNYLWRK